MGTARFFSGEHDLLDLFTVADYPRVEAETIDTRVQRGQRQAVIEVNIAAMSGILMPFFDIFNGCGGLDIGDGDADDFAVVLLKLFDLPDR